MIPVHLTWFCNDINFEVFRNVAELLFYGFQRAGARIEWAPRSTRSGALNVVLSAHRLPADQVPQIADACVILNFEQLCARGAWDVINAKTYRTLLQDSAVIDYSDQNREWLRRELNVEAELLMLGHEPELERIIPAREQDIDVLFYGKVTPRRKKILDALQLTPLRVFVVDGWPLCFGNERNSLIARSRVVLNLHAYDTHIFEQVRVNYLLINGKAVVSEVAGDTEIPDPYRVLIEPVWGVDAIVDRCRQLASSDALRRHREDLARDGMRRYPQSKLLAEIVCFKPALNR